MGEAEAGRRERLAAGFGSDDGDERYALAGRTAQVVGERQLLAVVDLALSGFAPQLEPRLEEHPQARRADGMTERLQAAIGIHRQLTVEIERPGEDFFPSEAAFGEP